MSNRPALISQADVARVIRAARQEGLEVKRIIVRRDGVSVETEQKAENEASNVVPLREVVL